MAKLYEILWPLERASLHSVLEFVVPSKSQAFLLAQEDSTTAESKNGKAN